LLFNRYEGHRSSRAQLCCYQASGWVQASPILVCGDTNLQIDPPTIFLLNFFSLTIWRIKKNRIVHCKKELAIFPSPAGMSLTKLSLGGKKLNYSRPGRV
jgi:hypothetical protein